MKDRERKRETESLLGSLPDERFAQLVSLGKMLTDWSNEQAQLVLNQGDRADDEMDEGVPVMIGSDDENDDDENGIREIDDNEDEDEENEEEEATADGNHGVIKGRVSCAYFYSLKTTIYL